MYKLGLYKRNWEPDEQILKFQGESVERSRWGDCCSWHAWGNSRENCV